jgi:hypothetical protein
MLRAGPMSTTSPIPCATSATRRWISALINTSLSSASCLNERVHLVACQLDDLARLADAKAHLRGAAEDHADVTGELSRTENGDQEVAQVGSAASRSLATIPSVVGEIDVWRQTSSAVVAPDQSGSARTNVRRNCRSFASRAAGSSRNSRSRVSSNDSRFAPASLKSAMCPGARNMCVGFELPACPQRTERTGIRQFRRGQVASLSCPDVRFRTRTTP